MMIPEKKIIIRRHDKPDDVFNNIILIKQL